MSADLHAMVCYSMRDLSEQIGKLVAQSNGRIDLATKAHLSETKVQIDRVLNTPYINMPGGGGGQIIILGQPAK